MLSPTLVYTVRHPPLATPNWQWELQNRKWRANAEHIVKLEWPRQSFCSLRT